MNNKKHRRKWLTLEEKLKIIETHEKGKSSTKIARELGMNESSVRSILRRQDFYKTLGNTMSLRRFKSFARCRSTLLDRVEKQLTIWIEDRNQKRILLTETEIQRKALDLFNELRSEGDGSEKFSASRGWFYRFKNRINLQNCVISGEEPPPNRAATEEFQAEFARIIEEGDYTYHQIFNVEETSLYWKKMPSQSFLLDNEKNLQGHKPSRDSLTLCLGSNAAGDFKLKPMIVYRSETPSALRNCDKYSLPVIWRSNTKAWLSKELFEEWFTNYFCPRVEAYCHTRGLDFKILLLLDSTRNYDALNCNENIKVVYLPPNTSSLLQPMTLGVFPSLKAKYIRQILSQALSAMPRTSVQEFWAGYNIRNAIDNISKCWCETSPEDLAASWHRLLPEVKVRDFDTQMANITQDVVTIGQCLGLKTIDVEMVHNCIDSTLQELDSPAPAPAPAPAPDLDSPPSALGLHAPELDSPSIPLHLDAPELDLTTPKLEEVICKEEVSDLFEEEFEQGPGAEELEKIIGNIDAACEMIARRDSDVERSIKVREILQNGIQPYRDLLMERTKQT